MHSKMWHTLAVKLMATEGFFGNPRGRADDEDQKQISLEELKRFAVNEIRQLKKYEEYEKATSRRKGTVAITTTHDVVICTKQFMAFTETDLCENMMISALFYASSTLALDGNGCPLTTEECEEQEAIKSESYRMLSGLYCRLLVSTNGQPFGPVNMGIREERVFFETLIYFLGVCTCYALHVESREIVYAIFAKVFRRGIAEPRLRKPIEFLPITESVRRHWLAQRVPGKVRAEIKHASYQGTSDLIEPMCEKELNEGYSSSGSDLWQRDGTLKSQRLPIGRKSFPANLLIDLSPPPKTPEEATLEMAERYN
jgi:hypothetical protein